MRAFLIQSTTDCILFLQRTLVQFLVPTLRSTKLLVSLTLRASCTSSLHRHLHSCTHAHMNTHTHKHIYYNHTIDFKSVVNESFTYFFFSLDVQYFAALCTNCVSYCFVWNVYHLRRPRWEWCLFLILPPECFWRVIASSVHTESCFNLYSLSLLLKLN